MGKVVKVVVGIPTEGKTEAEALSNRLTFMFHLGTLQEKSKSEDTSFEFYLATVGRLFTPMAREKIARHALDIDADYVFMIDDDMLSSPDIFEKLYRHDVDVVAGLAFTRNPPHLAVLYTSESGYDPKEKREFVKTDWVRNYPKDKLVQCDAVGFGCVLIKTDIIKKMKPPYFMSSCGTGEDILFCYRAGKAGAQIFMDTSTKLGHLSNPVIIDEDCYERMNSRDELDRLFGPYDKYNVREVSQLNDGTKSSDKGAEVLAGAS